MATAKMPHVNVQTDGEGSRTLIFVHGGACAAKDWCHQVQELSSRFGVVILDLPGHGLSGPPRAATVAGLADAVSEVLSHVPSKSVLVGHSLGCRVILEAYRRAPSSVSALIFVDGSLSASEGNISPVTKTRQMLDEMGTDTFLNFSFRQMFVPGSEPALVERVVSRAKAGNTALVEAVLLDTIRFDAYESADILRRIDVPVLLLQSSSIDERFQRISLAPGMTTAWTELVARTVPHHEMRVVEGVGHFPHLEAPDAVNAHIAGFMDRAVSDFDAPLAVA